MPKLPPKPCTKPGCGAYAVKGGRCADHVVKHRWRHTKSRHERGYGWQWEQIRRRALVRDNYLCQYCRTEGVYTPATDVDHRIPKTDGGTDHLDNLQSLCKNCHNEKTASEGKSKQ